jgi:hypothetical protein
MILTYIVLLVMVLGDDLRAPNTMVPEGGGEPVPAPAPKQDQLVSILFTGLTTAFAIYTGKILGIEITNPENKLESVNLIDKIKTLLASIWNGLSKGDLPKIGAALFVVATIVGFLIYLVEIRQAPDFSPEPLSDLLKNLASSFVGLILGVATSGNSKT